MEFHRLVRPRNLSLFRRGGVDTSHQQGHIGQQTTLSAQKTVTPRKPAGRSNPAASRRGQGFCVGDR